MKKYDFFFEFKNELKLSLKQENETDIFQKNLKLNT